MTNNTGEDTPPPVLKKKLRGGTEASAGTEKGRTRGHVSGEQHTREQTRGRERHTET